MPDGSFAKPLSTFPVLDCHIGKVDVFRFFFNSDEARYALNADIRDLEAARAVIEGAFNNLRNQAEIAKPGARGVLVEMLHYLIDMDHDTCGYALEKQAAAEAWEHDQ